MNRACCLGTQPSSSPAPWQSPHTVASEGVPPLGSWFSGPMEVEGRVGSPHCAAKPVGVYSAALKHHEEPHIRSNLQKEKAGGERVRLWTLREQAGVSLGAAEAHQSLPPVPLLCLAQRVSSLLRKYLTSFQRQQLLSWSEPVGKGCVVET